MDIATTYVIIVGIAAALVEGGLLLRAAFPSKSQAPLPKKSQSNVGYVSIAVVLTLVMAGFVAAFVSGAETANDGDVVGFIMGAIVSFVGVLVCLYAGLSRIQTNRRAAKLPDTSSK
jgi:hypothetical protein